MNCYPIFLVRTVPYETLEDKLALSGEMLLRGLGTVFLVLAILWGIIALFGVVAAGSAKKASKPAPAPAAAQPEEKPAPAAEPVPETPASDDAVIAAICAAVEAYRAEEGLSGLPYRVVSFKRRSGRKSWTGNSED